jgi:beta-N-acetylhexosaminidase
MLKAALLAAIAWLLAACGARTSTTAPSPTPSSTPSPPSVPVGSPSLAPEPSPSPSPGISLRTKIAGLLVVGFRGAALTDAPWLRTALTDGGLGGVILFDKDQLTGGARNVVSPEQLRGLVTNLRDAASGRDLIVAIDQEGGVVTRLSPAHGFPAVSSEAEIGAGTPDEARTWATGLAATLADMGINLNLAPVVDLNVNPDSPAIGALDRSFSADPDVVVEMATIEIEAHRADGVATALKHFPGIGSSTTNTDFGVADVTDTWSRTELEPFERLIGSGTAELVMVGHVVNGQLDPDVPASLSKPTVTGVLRDELAFEGPVITDDLQAGAIVAHFGAEEAITRALEAGVDLLLLANQQAYDEDVVGSAIDSIEAAVQAGRLDAARIDESWSRVQAWLAALARGHGD